MARYAAFLRGISPMNASMANLRRAFEAAGFTDVKTVISSGNVVFTTRAGANMSIERRAERAMQRELGRTFLTIVRPVNALIELLDADPYASFKLTPGSKRVVTFLRQPTDVSLDFPQSRDRAHIHTRIGLEIFSSYVPSGNSPDFMLLIEKAYGKEVTTRTWETIGRVVRAAG